MINMRDGQVITVEHLAKDGWHEFTCHQVHGFHLISQDAAGVAEMTPRPK